MNLSALIVQIADAGLFAVEQTFTLARDVIARLRADIADLATDRRRHVSIVLDPDALADPERASTIVHNAAYELSLAIFETCGEDNRRADGTRVLDCNGHHVAQGLAATVEARWKQHETTPKGESDE